MTIHWIVPGGYVVVPCCGSYAQIAYRIKIQKHYYTMYCTLVHSLNLFVPLGDIIIVILFGFGYISIE